MFIHNGGCAAVLSVRGNNIFPFYANLLLYSCVRACYIYIYIYIYLRSGWGSDGNVYNVVRGLRDFW